MFSENQRGIPPDDAHTLLQDTDGKSHLNYFAETHRTAAVGLHPVARVARWKEAHLQRISHEIQDLRRSTFPDAAHQAAK